MVNRYLYGKYLHSCVQLNCYLESFIVSQSILIRPDHSGCVTNNLVAYLTGEAKDEDHDWYRIALFILLVITIVNLTTSYTLIKIYLKLKHSEAIMIAEKSNLNVKSSFITFRCHVLLYIFFGGVCLSNFFFNTISFESHQAAAPAMCSVVNFLSTLFSLTFVFNKKDVWDYVKRRLTVFQSPSASQNKITPMNSRTVAWAEDSPGERANVNMSTF